jgi:hypothetical protein
MIFKYLSLDGLGVTKNANVNGSVTPQKFFVKPPANRIYDLRQLIIHIEDASVPPGSYGEIAALTNGVTIKVLNDADVEIMDLLDGGAAKTNDKYYHISPKVEFGDTVVNIYIPLEPGIALEPHERLEVSIDDDLTGLVEHFFYVSGQERSK